MINSILTLSLAHTRFSLTKNFNTELEKALYEILVFMITNPSYFILTQLNVLNIRVQTELQFVLY